MTINTVLTCPLGSKCEEIRDNAIHRCAWSVQMRGQDPSTGEDKDERACAMSWMPVLLVENSRQQVRTTSAVESFRNETVAANDATRQIMALASRIAPPGFGPGPSLPGGVMPAVIGG